MDRMLYVAMSGAKETLKAQAANNHNLANASTSGFRADMAAFQARAVTGAGFASRTYATASSTGFDSSSGAMVSTGRDLDVAVQGSGFIAVQGGDGREAYTRAGDLHVDPSGQLMTATGFQVMGENGPVSVPPSTSVVVGSDGTVSVVPLGQTAATMANVGQIKLVDPPTDQLVRGADGLFRLQDGTDAPSSSTTHLASGVLESSNVNLADAMVNMIELARRFDLQVKTMHTTEDDAAASAELLKSA